MTNAQHRFEASGAERITMSFWFIIEQQFRAGHSLNPPPAAILKRRHLNRCQNDPKPPLEAPPKIKNTLKLIQ